MDRNRRLGVPQKQMFLGRLGCSIGHESRENDERLGRFGLPPLCPFPSSDKEAKLRRRSSAHLRLESTSKHLNSGYNVSELSVHRLSKPLMLRDLFADQQIGDPHIGRKTPNVCEPSYPIATIASAHRYRRALFEIGSNGSPVRRSVRSRSLT